MIVIDTHILIWAVEADPRLSVGAAKALDLATSTTGAHLSAISPWEIAMLAHEGRLALGQELGGWIAAALSLPGVHLAPILPAIALDSVNLPGRFHADPADRLIIATARHLGLPLLTADQAILSYGASGYVRVIGA